MSLRLLLTVVLGAFVVRLPSLGVAYASTWWIIILLGGGIVLTFSLQGHGAAQGSVLAVVVIWLHLAATTVWLGGLPMLFYPFGRRVSRLWGWCRVSPKQP
jgi:putative copper export protein